MHALLLFQHNLTSQHMYQIYSTNRREILQFELDSRSFYVFSRTPLKISKIFIEFLIKILKECELMYILDFI